MTDQTPHTAEKGVFHSARVMTHTSGNAIECSCGWSVVMPAALGVINAYGDHRAAAARLSHSPGRTAE